jgi:hypothetical protein
MARLRHPNIVTIYGAERIEGVTGLSMELVEGRTLAAELAERGPFDAKDLAAVGRQLCAALAAVHAAGLVHRDVKASNVMRDKSGRLVLGDFGTGIEIERARSATGALAGTPVYLAPEVFEGGPATQRSDIYSLGTLLFHLATGEFPQAPGSLSSVRTAHRQEPPRSLRTVRDDLPPSLLDAVDAALATDPASRHASAEAMAEALEPARQPARAWLGAAAGSTLVVAVVGAILWPRGVVVEALAPEAQPLAHFVGRAVNDRIACYQDVPNLTGGQWPGLAVCNLANGTVTPLGPGGPEGYMLRGPTGQLSPDGTRIAYVWNVETASQRVNN